MWSPIIIHMYVVGFAMLMFTLFPDLLFYSHPFLDVVFFFNLFFYSPKNCNSLGVQMCESFIYWNDILLFSERIHPTPHSSSLWKPERRCPSHRKGRWHQFQSQGKFKVHLYQTKANAKENFSDLCRCSLNWVLYEPIWNWCHLRLRLNISDSYSDCEILLFYVTRRYQ